MRIVFVRHTRVAVAPGTCYGWTDVPVADTFEQEAAVTKGLLQAYGPFDAVFSSPLTRARLLASYCGYPDAILDDRLKELNMGRWEMQRYDDIVDPLLQQWYDDYLYVSTPDGESFLQQYQRVSNFITSLRQKPYRQVAVFAHAGIQVAASIFFKAFPFEEAWHHVSEYKYGGIIDYEL